MPLLMLQKAISSRKGFEALPVSIYAWKLMCKLIGNFWLI